jgi:hypothetical protein
MRPDRKPRPESHDVKVRRRHAGKERTLKRREQRRQKQYRIAA